MDLHLYLFVAARACENLDCAGVRSKARPLRERNDAGRSGADPRLLGGAAADGRRAAADGRAQSQHRRAGAQEGAARRDALEAMRIATLAQQELLDVREAVREQRIILDEMRKTQRRMASRSRHSKPRTRR